MITKYEEFLIESLMYSINESNLLFSNKFAGLLHKIDSPISKALLSVRNKDLELINNYFDIDTKDTITFVSDKKAQKMIEEPNKFYNVVEPSSVVSPLLFSDEHIIKIRLKNAMQEAGYKNIEKIINDNLFSHIPKIDEPGELVADFSAFYTTFVVLKFGDKFALTTQVHTKPIETPWIKNRQPIRIGRGIKALTTALGFKFTDAEVEDFVNKWKASFDIINDIFRNFELVKGDLIAHWYDSDNYEEGVKKGQLGSSCMAMKPTYYFDIYSKNPEVCSLLILKSDKNPELIVGRAIVWTIEPMNITFMDRVYTHEDNQIYLFKEYAKSKGWHYKRNNDSSSEIEMVGPDGSRNHPSLAVKIKPLNYRYYPYVDSLKYMTDSRDYSTLSNVEEGADWLLESTGGQRYSTVCEYCNGEGYVDCGDCHGDGSVQNDCWQCNANGYVDCETCEGEGYIHSEGEEEKDCDDCGTKGRVECSDCDGNGTVTEDCDSCDGRGRVRCRECN
jgi:hypothetical protein